MENTIQYSELFNIVITALLTTFLTSIAYHLKVENEKKYEHNFKALQLVYNPIIKVLDHSIEPGIGYEGFDYTHLSHIEEIISNNAIYVDPRLEAFIWGFREDARYRDLNYYLFDENGRFQYYVNKTNHKLRKKVKLKYEKKYVGTGVLTSYIMSKFKRLNSKRKRAFRKLKSKMVKKK